MKANIAQPRKRDANGKLLPRPKKVKAAKKKAFVRYPTEYITLKEEAGKQKNEYTLDYVKRIKKVKK